jgi:hypothetical protein
LPVGRGVFHSKTQFCGGKHSAAKTQKSGFATFLTRRGAYLLIRSFCMFIFSLRLHKREIFPRNVHRRMLLQDIVDVHSIAPIRSPFIALRQFIRVLSWETMCKGVMCFAVTGIWKNITPATI